jgi:hypothetical protein
MILYLYVVVVFFRAHPDAFSLIDLVSLDQQGMGCVQLNSAIHLVWVDIYIQHTEHRTESTPYSIYWCIYYT